MKILLILISLFFLAFGAEIKLSNHEALQIANKIWMNEGSGKKISLFGGIKAKSLQVVELDTLFGIPKINQCTFFMLFLQC